MDLVTSVPQAESHECITKGQMPPKQRLPDPLKSTAKRMRGFPSQFSQNGLGKCAELGWVPPSPRARYEEGRTGGGSPPPAQAPITARGPKFARWVSIQPRNSQALSPRGVC